MAVLVPSIGLKVITGRMIGSTPTQAEPKYMGWGTGAGTTAASDETLFGPGPEARVTGTSSQQTTTTTSDTFQVVGTITSSAGGTYTNVGLFDLSSAAPATSLTGSGITSSGQTSITVASASGFPNSGNYDIQILSEVLTVTAGQGTTTWTVLRAQNGSTALTSAASSTGVVGGVATTGGNIYFKADFDGLILNASDSVTFTLSSVFSG